MARVEDFGLRFKHLHEKLALSYASTGHINIHFFRTLAVG
jgi:hypothetical protein